MTYKKPIPKIRNEKEVDLRSSVAGLVHKFLNGEIAYKNCLNCTHWNISKDICGKYNSLPPPDVIVYSCESHEDNCDIPF